MKRSVNFTGYLEKTELNELKTDKSNKSKSIKLNEIKPYYTVSVCYRGRLQDKGSACIVKTLTVSSC